MAETQGHYRARELLADPTTPYWIRELLPLLLRKDPLDVAQHIEVLHQWANQRLAEVLPAEEWIDGPIVTQMCDPATTPPTMWEIARVARRKDGKLVDHGVELRTVDSVDAETIVRTRVAFFPLAMAPWVGDAIHGQAETGLVDDGA